MRDLSRAAVVNGTTTGTSKSKEQSLLSSAKLAARVAATDGRHRQNEGVC